MFGISRRYSQFEMWKMTDPARRADGILITTTERETGLPATSDREVLRAETFDRHYS